MQIANLDLGFLKDFIPPASLFTLVATYIFTKFQDNSKYNQAINSKKISVIDTLVIGLNEIEALFGSLKIDAEKQNFFTYKNINLAHPIVGRMQKVIDDVIIFPDDTLRRDILETIESLTSLIDDVNSLENLATNEDMKFNQIKTEYEKQLRDLRINSIKMNIQIDQNLQISDLSTKSTKHVKQIQTIQLAVSSLSNEYFEASNNQNNLKQYCKDKRVFYAIRISDAQAEIRDLNKKLSDARKVISKNN